MATTTTQGSYDTGARAGGSTTRKVPTFTETKAGPKTTEFMFMVLFIVAVLVATYIDGDDSLHAEDGWLFACIAASAYFISRGLAKMGVREPDTEEIDIR